MCVCVCVNVRVSTYINVLVCSDDNDVDVNFGGGGEEWKEARRKIWNISLVKESATEPVDWRQGIKSQQCGGGDGGLGAKWLEQRLGKKIK